MSQIERTPELKPEITFIYELLANLTSGSLRVPKFQRPYIWRRAQMIDLFDSVRKQYPIGSLLTWETDAQISSLDFIGRIALPRKSGQVRTDYLLDGHQRVSTLAGALLPPSDLPLPAEDDDPGRWHIFFNAATDRFEHLPLKTLPATSQFPLSRLLDTVEFLEECQRVLGDAQHGRDWVSKIQSVARSFQNYKVPLIRIRDTGLNEAVEIFARLNSKGQAMTADQMISALLYREGSGSFDLAREIDEVASDLDALGFGGIDRAVILRTLLAAVGEGIYQTDWTRIARSRRDELLSQLEAALPGVRSALTAAATFLRTEVGVWNVRLLPYSMQLVVLSAFYFAAPQPSEAQVSLLRRWFWVSSFATWFGGTNPSRVNDLVREVMDRTALDRVTPQIVSMDLDAPAEPLPRAFDMRSARARALVLVLLSLRPLQPDGRLVEGPEDFLVLYGPEALSRICAVVSDRVLASSPANRLIRPDPPARGQARTWLQSLSPSLASGVCESHAVPVQALQLLGQTDGAEFLRARLRHLIAVERTFMEEQFVVPPLNDDPLPAPADAD